MLDEQAELKRAILRQWNELAESYLAFRRQLRGYNELVLDRHMRQLLGDMKGRRVLDAGCGAGDLAIYCARTGADVTAVDVSERMIEEARRGAAREGVTIDARVGNIESLHDFADASFDAIICSVVVAGCLRPIIREFGRLLCLDGLLLLSDVHPMLNKGVQEARDGIPCLVVSNYFDRSVRSVTDPFGPNSRGVKTPFFFVNYTLEDYFDALAANRFVVEKYREPAPGRCGDSEKIDRANSYPFFFLIQARKTADRPRFRQ